MGNTIEDIKNISCNYRKKCAVCERELSEPTIRLPGLPLTEILIKEKSKEKLSMPAFIVVLLTGTFLMFGVSDIPKFGDSSAPAHQYLSDRYVNKSPNEIGVPNMVTSVLASYRGYDTMGEVTVIFTAGIAVLMLLGRGFRRRGKAHEKGNT